MSKAFQLSAEFRDDTGKGASRRLRRLGDKVPGIIYGGGEEPVALTLQTNQLSKAMQSDSFYSQILNVVVNGQLQQAVIRDLQRHPADEKVMHVDFMRIRADQVIEVHVPLRFANEDRCVGVRLGGGTITHNLNEVEVSCLPKDLPEFLEVDMENVELNEVVRLTDIPLPEGVSVVALMHGAERDATVASVQPPRGVGEEDELEEGVELAEGEEATGEAPEGEDAGDEAPSED